MQVMGDSRMSESNSTDITPLQQVNHFNRWTIMGKRHYNIYLQVLHGYIYIYIYRSITCQNVAPSYSLQTEVGNIAHQLYRPVALSGGHPIGSWSPSSGFTRWCENLLAPCLNHGLVHGNVRGTHPQHLYHDVGGGFTEVSSLHHMLKTLRNQRVLRDILKAALMDAKTKQPVW